MGWIESLVSWISGLIGRLMTDGPLKDLLLDGVIRRGRRYCILTQHSDTICIHIVHGRFGLYGPGGIHNGQTHAQDGIARKIVYSSCDGIRLQRAGHNVDTHNRKQVKPTYNDSDQPLHQLFGAYTDLCPACGSLLPRARSIGVCRTLSFWESLSLW